MPINAISDALGLPSRQPLAGGLALTGGALLRNYAALNLRRVVSGPEDEARAIGILQTRVRLYRARLAGLPSH